LADIVKNVQEGNDLTSADMYRLRNHNSALWGFIYSQWVQEQLGLAGRFATKDLGMFGLALTMPGAVDWWKANADLVYPEDFCRYVEAKFERLAPLYEGRAEIY